MRSIIAQSLLGALVCAGGFTAEARAQGKMKADVKLVGIMSRAYNSAPFVAMASTNAPGDSRFNFTYNGLPVAPTAVGSYTVVCTLVNDKFEGTATGKLVITKAMAAVFLDLTKLNQKFDGKPKTIKATSSAPGFPDFEFTYNGSTFAPTQPGTYTVVAKLKNPNYEGSATGVLVISKAK